MPTALEKLKARLYDVNALAAAGAMLDWDQQTYMPKGGAAARAEHSSILSRMHHELFVSDETQRLVEEAGKEAEPGSVDGALVRVVKRNLDQETKIPTDLVAEKAKLGAEAHEKWVEARKNNDFQAFQPYLEKMFEFARREAEYLGYTDHIYDALLDRFEQGATAADVRAMFEKIKGPSVELIQAIGEAPNQPDDSFLTGEWDVASQQEFTLGIVKAIGFDLDRGRQDTAPHPFCTGWSVGDIRLTTRFKPQIDSAIFGSLHEAGHGMYEQGSPVEWDRLPIAGGVSLGVHESQSRLWENIVGRSRAFWSHFLPSLQAKFPALAGVDLDTWYRGINKVSPSLIRVEADELTYNMHILVRFEIECDLLTGALAVKDLPEAWNAKYEQYLGLTPPTDSDGCLQDVHWSFGGIGYFPTYSFGNLLSYQFWAAMKKDVPDPDALMARGDFAPIFGWLHERIYAQGSRYEPKDLVMQVTGKPMSADDYLAGLTAKYKAIYSL